MKKLILYIATVVIWGSTWLAIEYQLGEAAVLTSVFYRFVIAAVIMWAYCLLAKVPMAFSARDHVFIFILALFNFSMNYVLIYLSQEHLTSAMTSIAFSTMLIMNIINARLFFATHISARVYIGAGLGLLGLLALFWNDLAASDENSLLGLALVMSSSLLASLGNMTSVRNSRKGMNIFAVNAWGMLYGALVLALVVLTTGSSFSASWEPAYTLSLLYLAVFGTVIAFATYYVLLNDMGPEKASYVIVLFPVVAVILSSLFEDFTWSPNIFVGFALVIIGNAIVLTPVDKIKQHREQKRARKVTAL